MSVPVLSRSLIGDRTAPGRALTSNDRDRKAMAIHENPRLGPGSSPGGLTQAHRWISSLPAQSPITPTLRANPYPEVTDPICRLPLPTLFYRPEAVNLGDLLRIWVRAGATPPLPPQDFQGPTDHSWMPRELRHSSPEPKPILPAIGFQGLSGLCRKDNSSQSFGGRLLVTLCYHDGYEGPNGSAARFWNMNRIPFRLQRGIFLYTEKIATRLIKASPKP